MNDSEHEGTERGKDSEPQRDHEIVEISVNGEKIHIHRGRQSVCEIKHLGHVPQADVLAEVVDGKLVDLPNDSSVTIKGGEVFYSHPQDSGSSQN